MTTSPIIPARLLAHDHDHEDHAHDGHDSGSELDRGLTYDVNSLLRRRGALGLLGGAGLVALAGCASAVTSAGSTSASASASASATAGASGSAAATTSAAAAASAVAAPAASPTAATTVVDEETAGPYPGDGSNGKDVLVQSGVVRKDISTSIGSGTRVAGVPMTLNLTVTDSSKGYAAWAGAAVYVWHADGQGRYSMYSRGVENETFLRGVQSTDASGTATFTSVVPGCYDGRWPHIHFEVYASEAQATASGQIVRTSQIALPQAVCEQVYGDTTAYPQSAANLARVSLTKDMVFGNDGGIHQLATVTGDPSTGYVVNLTIGV